MLMMLRVGADQDQLGLGGKKVSGNYLAFITAWNQWNQAVWFISQLQSDDEDVEL